MDSGRNGLQIIGESKPEGLKMPVFPKISVPVAAKGSGTVAARRSEKVYEVMEHLVAIRFAANNEEKVAQLNFISYWTH
jgi:hypothetical protein